MNHSNFIKNYFTNKLDLSSLKNYENQYKDFFKNSTNILNQSCLDLEKIISQYNIFQILSSLSFNFLLQRYNLKKNNICINIFELEIIQSILLKNNGTYSFNFYKDSEKLFDILRTSIVADTLKHSSFSLENPSTNDILLNQIKNDFYAVRIDYPYAYKIAKQIFEPFNNSIKKELSIDIISFINMMEHIDISINNRFCASINDCNNYNSNTYNMNIFTITLDEMLNFYGSPINRCQLKYYIDNFSFKQNDLQIFSTEDIIHKNPAKEKFIINCNNDSYFIPNITKLKLNIFKMCEKIILNNVNLTKIYNGRTELSKGHLFERVVENVLKNRFENYSIYSNSLYINPNNKKECENDFLILVHNYAIIIECKSGEIKEEAKNGNQRKIKKVRNHLIDEASNQADGFLKFLTPNLGKQIVLKTSNKTSNNIDLTSTTKFIQLNLVLEPSSSMYTNKFLMYDLKTNSNNNLNIIPTITLYDLILTFDLLDNINDILSYFLKRTYLDNNVLYNADEVDILQGYLYCGYNTEKKLYDNSSFNNNLSIMLSPNSVPISNYLIGISSKPKIDRTNLWTNLLNSVHCNTPQHYTDITLSLLDVPPIVQRQIEKNIIESKELILSDNIESRKKIIYSPLINKYEASNLDIISIKQQLIHMLHESKLKTALIIIFIENLNNFIVDIVSI